MQYDPAYETGKCAYCGRETHPASVHTCSKGCQKPGCSRKYLDEIADLKAEVEQSKRINTELLVLSERQASDIRRLTKAGDAMANAAFNDSTGLWVTKPFQAWEAAKQGGQP